MGALGSQVFLLFKETLFMADKKTAVASTETAPAEEPKALGVQVAEAPEPQYELDPELEAKFGKASKPPMTLKSAEHATEHLLGYQKIPLPPEDDLLSPEDWLRRHMNRIAGFDVKADIRPHRWQKDVLMVDANGVGGSISLEHVKRIRARRDLRAVDLAIGRGWMSGFLPELADYAEW